MLPVGRSLLWIITLALPFIFLALLAYLLRNWIAPLDWSSLKVGDFANLIGLGIGVFAALIAISSLFVALAQFRQAINDSKEQQKNLEASRQQLQTVADTLKQQQETLTKGLETSKDLFALQKEQQMVLAQSLETTKSLYQLQKEERERVQKLANRKPKIEAFVGDQAIVQKSINVDMRVVGDINESRIPLMVTNIGSATLMHPLILAVLSNDKLSVQLKGAHDPAEPTAYRSQLGGSNILDLLSFTTSKSRYDTSLLIRGLSVLAAVDGFDINYSLSGENLEEPFVVHIHIDFKRDQANGTASGASQ